MCNRFNLKTNLATLGDLFDAMLSQRFEIAEDVFPNQPTPVIAINRDRRRELLPMRFGLIPFGKAPSTQKRALTNARVENLNKWPWRSSIKSHRCVVPMDGFREPCYWGQTAGTEVDFSAQDGRPMLAAGIYSWFEVDGDDGDPDLPTRPTLTMSLIMRPALPIVMRHGHHRSPFFLSEDGIDDWMSRDSRSLDESWSILKTHAIVPELTATVAREMAPAWTKRQAEHLAKRDEQLAAIDENGELGIGS